MGNNSSTVRAPRSYAECFDEDGYLDEVSYHLYQRHLRRMQDDIELDELISGSDDEEEVSKKRKRPQMKPRSECESHLPLKILDDGSVVTMKPHDTAWWATYVAFPKTDLNSFHKKFRRRFRMSYKSYLILLEMVKSHEMFSQWRPSNRLAFGYAICPVELLLLGTLRYFGRGWTMDDLSEATAISESTFRRFIHVYITFGSTVLYDKYVGLPSSPSEIRNCMAEFATAGLHGAFGSTDATHVGMRNCPYGYQNLHDSFKLDMPTRTYNVTVNHRRKILSSTRGHPGRWNDKTLILFDDLAMGIKNGKLYHDVQYKLFETDANDEVKEVLYQGVWLIVDNGYLRWPTTVPPLKTYLTYAEKRFSKWLESIRKDVECTFGILKGRFRILKSGIPLHGIEATDKIFLTCCALHNFLLLEDGLDESWLGDDGKHDSRDIGIILKNLDTNTLEMENYDSSGMGPGKDRCDDGCNNNLNEEKEEEPDDQNNIIEYDKDGAIIVHKLRLTYFRKKLIEHYDILYRKKKIIWPSRNGLGNPPTWFGKDY